MTCAKCNTLTVIDSSNARSFAAVLNNQIHPDVIHTVKTETLPKCEKCGSTADWWDGSHNLINLQAANKKDLANRIIKEKNATIKIQSAYRRYLRRRWGRAEVQKQLANTMLIYRAAACIQTIMRGRLGRRRALTFVAVRIISWANDDLLKRALKGDKTHKRRCFWYTKEQVPEVYRDYLNVAMRTGFDPPRADVEINLWEIARRIRVKEAHYARLVQKRFRGMQARRFLLIYLQELVRLRDIRTAAAYRIQRLYRGWSGRRRAEGIIVAKYKDGVLKSHLRSRRLDDDKRKADELRVKLLAKYSKERAEERTARLIGLVHPDAAQGKKMAAFKDSAYGSDSVSDLMGELTTQALQIKKREKDEEAIRVARADFLHKEQARGGKALEIYFEEEMRQRSVDLIERLVTDMPAFSRASLLKDHNDNHKGKSSFKFPKSVYIEPSHALYEDTGVSPPDRHVAAEARRKKRLAAQETERLAAERAARRLEARKSSWALKLQSATTKISASRAFSGSHGGTEGGGGSVDNGGGGGGGGGETGNNSALVGQDSISELLAAASIGGSATEN